MTRYCWRVGNVEWRIPALSLPEATALLCRILYVTALPDHARYIGEIFD